MQSAASGPASETTLHPVDLPLLQPKKQLLQMQIKG
jgi:hypothetical protein